MLRNRSPALAYGVLALLIGIAAGGIYFFRSYRREGEDFTDDEEDEEEIYEKEDEENDGNVAISGKMRIWQEKMERKERRKNFIVKGGAFLYN